MSEPTESELAAAEAHYHGPGCGDPGEYNGFLEGVSWQKRQNKQLEIAIKGLTDLSNTIGFSEIMRIYAKDILRQIEQLGKEAK